MKLMIKHRGKMKFLRNHRVKLKVKKQLKYDRIRDITVYDYWMHASISYVTVKE